MYCRFSLYLYIYIIIYKSIPAVPRTNKMTLKIQNKLLNHKQPGKCREAQACFREDVKDG